MIKPCYQSDRVTVYHGDCLEIMPDLPKVDAVVTDPPYGIGHKTHGQIFKKAQPIAGDESTEIAETIRMWAAEKNITCCMFYSPYVPMGGWRTILCWAKGAHVGIGGDRATCWKRDFELIGVERNGELFGKRDTAVLRVNAVSPPPSGHFAEKPEALMRYLIVKLQCDNVLDPFAGSGTTAIACIREGKHCTLIEREQQYIDIICKRVEAEEAQGRLF